MMDNDKVRLGTKYRNPDTLIYITNMTIPWHISIINGNINLLDFLSSYVQFTVYTYFYSYYLLTWNTFSLN